MKAKRPNFKIVESVPSDVDYEEFKGEFLNPSIKASDIKKKYNMSMADYRDYRQRVLDEEGIDKKPVDWKQRFKGARRKMLDNTTNIQQRKGSYYIKKHIDGEHRYFGTYSDLDTARMVRDKLIECNWDKEVGAELMKKYSINRTKALRERAVKMFPKYEHYYVHRKDMSVAEIIKELHLSHKLYLLLTDMIHEKYGLPRSKI